MHESAEGEMQRDPFNFAIHAGTKYNDHIFVAVHYHVAESFPIKNGVSTQLSPRELILWHELDAGKHCKTVFGHTVRYTMSLK